MNVADGAHWSRRTTLLSGAGLLVVLVLFAYMANRTGQAQFEEAGRRLTAVESINLRLDGEMFPLMLLEVTESAAIEHQETIGSCLQALANAGFGLALDDFGTGYANFSNVTRFPFHKLKVDRSLLPKAGDERGTRVFSNVVRMAREIGLEVVAEGVETASELAVVRAAGCPVVQGYYYSRPLAAAQVTEVLKNGLPTPASAGCQLPQHR